MTKLIKNYQIPIIKLIKSIIFYLAFPANTLIKTSLKSAKNALFVRSLFTADYNSTKKTENPRKNAASQPFFLIQYNYG